MIQQTSLLAYSSIICDLNKRQALILAAVQEYGPMTNLELSRILALPINSITPRVLELRRKGYLVEDEIITQSTGRKAIRWKVI